MPKRPSNRLITRWGAFRGFNKSGIGSRVELYCAAYKLAFQQVATLPMRERADTPLRIHASIRRQLKEGANNASLIAAQAVSDLTTDTVVIHKKDARTLPKTDS